MGVFESNRGPRRVWVATASDAPLLVDELYNEDHGRRRGRRRKRSGKHDA